MGSCKVMLPCPHTRMKAENCIVNCHTMSALFINETALNVLQCPNKDSVMMLP